MRNKINLALLSLLLVAGAAWRTFDAWIPTLFTETINHQPYEYMFSQAGAEVTLYDQTFTSFEAGFKGILLYSGMKTAMEGAIHEAYSNDFYNISVLNDIAGIPAFTDGKTEINDYMSDDFLHYNPEFVYWAFENLIPTPQESLDGVSYQTIYDAVGARFFRLLAETYIILSYLDDEIGDYERGMQEGDFDVWEFMDQRAYLFTDLREQYAALGADSPFTPEMAYTWWIRRSLDGSDYALWDGISNVLMEYDPEFYESLWDE